MRTEPTQLQRIVTGVLAIAFASGLGLWLSMSYFGIWTSDAKVSVDMPELGDAIGPGAKVRYHGIIVGRVLKLSEHGDAYRVSIVVDEEHAKSIPADATARILPSTVFGSEFIELLSERDAADGEAHLTSGSIVKADESEQTLRLMTSFDQAERLLSAVDAEDINEITGKLAPALDSHGDDIKSFLERADATVTELNADLPTVWNTLELAPPAIDTIESIRPDLVSAMQHSQKTLDTVADRNKQLGTLLDASVTTIDRGNTLMAKNAEVIVPFVARLERLTGLVADNGDGLGSILARFAATGQNGAKGVDENAIQMIGTIGTDIEVGAYTPDDCARYGPTLIASNCGDPVPVEDEPAETAADDAELDAIAGRIQAMFGEATDDKSVESQATPAAGAQATGVSGFDGLLGLLTGLGTAIGGSR